MSKELVELLTTDGIVGFLARQSGLPVTRVARIFRMGEPWPLIGQESCALGLRAVQLGMDHFTFISPTAGVSLKDVESKLGIQITALVRGEVPRPVPELDNLKMSKNLEKISDLSEEKIDAIWKIYKAILFYLRRVGELAHQPLRQAEADV